MTGILPFSAPTGGAPKALRPYQIRGLELGRQAYREGKRAILFVGPTGMGKTRLGTEFVQNAIRGGRRVLWLAHRRELLTQARDAIRGEGVSDVGIIAASLPQFANPRASVQIASLQTLLARDELPPADLVVFDEAHHFVSSEWHAFAEKYKSATRLGLTATPVRSDGTAMGDLFDALVPVTSVRELTEQGFLVPCHVIGPARHQGGDLAQSPVDAWKQYARNERTVVFARSVEHSKELCAEFRAAGARAAHVDGGTNDVLRSRALDDFKAGHIDVLCNVFVLTEGFDAPGASCCILARGCGSVGTYLQMVGRVLRPAPGKTKAILLDLPGAVHLHGMPDEDREYSLDGEGIKEKKMPLKTCPSCAAVFRPAPVCPSCGHVFPVEIQKPDITGVDLRRLSFADIDDTHRKDAYTQLCALAESRGYKPGWAFYRFVSKFGMKPPFAWKEEVPA